MEYEPDSIMDQDHREWLEDRGSDQLEREAYERELGSRRGWSLATVHDHGPVENGPFIAVNAWRRGLVFEFSLHDAVTFANAILSEVEIAQTWTPTHWSISDGSGARLVDERGDGTGLFVNENGDTWTDPVSSWEPITEEET